MPMHIVATSAATGSSLLQPPCRTCVALQGTGHTAQEARRQARMKAEEQTERYAAVFAKQNPGMVVLAGTCCEKLSDIDVQQPGGRIPQFDCWMCPAYPANPALRATVAPKADAVVIGLLTLIFVLWFVVVDVLGPAGRSL